MAIMISLLAMAGAMLGRGDAGDATRVAAKELRALVEQAQARAVSSGNQTAVLIYKKWDGSAAASNDRCLRFVIVAELANVGTVAAPVYQWRPVGNGKLMANGAYYWPKSGVGFDGTFAATEVLSFGAAFTGTTKDDWYGFIFNPQGAPESSTGTKFTSNPKLLVTGGSIANGTLDVSDKEKLLTEGFMLQRSNGRVVAIENPTEQLSL